MGREAALHEEPSVEVRIVPAPVATKRPSAKLTPCRNVPNWRELAAYNPEAKVVLTVRDADSWFDSVSETIFSEKMQGSLVGSPAGDMMQGVIFDHFDGDIRDRAYMTQWFTRRNQEVINSLPPERLLVFHPKQGWEPLCRFLGVPVPDVGFPRVNSRDELSTHSDNQGGLPPDPESAEHFARIYIYQQTLATPLAAATVVADTSVVSANGGLAVSGPHTSCAAAGKEASRPQATEKSFE